MTYIYMDESWDLGFDKTKSRTTRYFIVTFSFVKQEKIADNIIKKTFKRLKWKWVKIRTGIFHSFKESDSSIEYLLSTAVKEDIKIMTLIVDKEKIYTRLHDQKHILYNRIVNSLINSVINDNLLPINEKINFIASRRETTKSLNENFLNYLKSKNKDWPNIEFSIKAPQEKWLQLADCLSFAIYQKYEKRNSKFYDIINKKIVIEKQIFE